MTALGTLAIFTPPAEATYIRIAKYTVVRGNYLGTITPRDAASPNAELNPAVGLYLVRQLSIVYRQLWPTHGQRFPQ